MKLTWKKSLKSYTNARCYFYSYCWLLATLCSKLFLILAYWKCKTGLVQQKRSLVHLPVDLYHKQNTVISILSYWPATVTLEPHSSGWLLQGQLIGSFFYGRQQGFAQEEGAGLQGESSRWNEAWLSWCHGKQLSGGARELVPGSVCRKGLSCRDHQLDRYVSQEPHYPALSASPTFRSLYL